jgi:EpsI family protein
VKPARLAVVVSLVFATVLATRGVQSAALPRPIDLDALPLRIGQWQGQDAGPLDDETLRILSADAYVNRSYEAGAAGQPIGVYAAYYAQQRPGVSIHSPLHCLPGTGWEPLDVTTRDVRQPDGSTGYVRRMVVQKDRQQAVVVYWYSVHGRMVASEVLSKAWLLHDSLRYQRSDAALLRVVVPVAGSVEAAEREGVSFAESLLPYVSRFWS